MHCTDVNQVVYCMKSVEALFCDLIYLPVEVILFMISSHWHVQAMPAFQKTTALLYGFKATGGPISYLIQYDPFSECIDFKLNRDIHNQLCLEWEIGCTFGKK